MANEHDIEMLERLLDNTDNEEFAEMLCNVLSSEDVLDLIKQLQEMMKED